jgi:alpha-tubulin suppressor-like RCC1 family protein
MENYSSNMLLRSSMLLLIVLLCTSLVSAQNFRSQKIVQCSSGGLRTLAIDESGNLWEWVRDYSEQPGDTSKTPDLIMSDKKFKVISAGDEESFAIDDSGNLWGWGDNGNGQLGDGTDRIHISPEQIKTGTKFKSVSSGDYHTMAIDESGNLWIWGDNDYYQLGDGTKVESFTPKQLKPDTKFISVSAGYMYSMAIDESGNLWGWGYNSIGQVGNGTTDNVLIPVQIAAGTKFKTVSASPSQNAHTLAIDESGNLWAWGDNWYGQLGDNSTEDKLLPEKILSDHIFTTVSAGLEHSVAVDNLGNLWVWGTNDDGELGNGVDEWRCPTPVITKKGTIFNQASAGHSRTLAADSRGILWLFGVTCTGYTGDRVTYKKPYKLNGIIVPVEGISMSPESFLMNVNNSEKMNVTIMPIDASNTKVTWSSSDPAVATIDTTGYLIAKSVGQTTITATTVDGNKTASCLVTVVISITNISLPKEVIQLGIGSTYQLIPVISPANATKVPLTWSSEDETKATVDSTGLVTAISMGFVDVTVTSPNGWSSYCTFLILPDASAPEIGNNSQFMVFPNPVKGGLLNVNLNQQINTAELSIYNHDAKLVYFGSITNNKTIRLDYQSFPKGIYLIRVSNKEINWVQKVVVE